ncbi:MAG: sulfatase-like hydrolase/transferase [Candidatus Promineifilaceae bacterium]
MKRPPHILYILSDEHCGFATGYMGDPNLRTPNLDRLAAEGVAFSHAYANSPICTPSRGTLFSGRHSHAGPVQHFFDVYKATAPSTATLLRDAGYRTAFFGKWHLGVVRDQMSPAVRENPTVYPEIDYFRRTPEYHRAGFQDWYAFELNDDPFNFAYYEQDAVNPIRRSGYQTDLLTEMVINYLEDYSLDNPLFLVLSVEPPHFPLEAPSSFERFDPAAMQTRPNFGDTPEMRRALATYYAMIENLDWNIGRLLKSISKIGRFQDNFLTVYFSDHGDYMGSHGLIARKEYPHEEGVRIPLIFHWPGQIPAQTMRNDLFSMIDMLPTTLDLAGQAIPGHIQGQSFAPACLGLPFSGPASVLLEMNNNPRWSLDFIDWRASVSHRWKYAYFETGHELLYDLQNDPYEMDNIADSEPEIRERLKEELLRLLAESREPYFDVLIQNGVPPAQPVINVSERWRGGIAPTWQDMIITKETQ